MNHGQVIEEGDEILVLAEDDDSYECNDGSISKSEVGDLPVVPKKVGMRRRFERDGRMLRAACDMLHAKYRCAACDLRHVTYRLGGLEPLFVSR